MVEHLEIRCPRLGGQVTFGYCRWEQGRLPCRQTLVCWRARFPVETYLRAVLGEEEWDRCFNEQPGGKVQTLLELIDKAQRDLGGKGS